jgi:uncharacterized protein
MSLGDHEPRLLIVPGLNDSGPAHWQSWLQAQFRDARRVEQRDWSRPDLERWAERIASTLDRERGDGPWVAVAHSFGCLALARHLAQRPDTPVRAALFVAPAEPDRFGVAESLPRQRLAVTSTVIASDNDPWMSAASSRRWAQRWGSGWLTLGQAGHINAESGFGPLPLARRWVASASARLARERRPQRADFAEWSFAV